MKKINKKYNKILLFSGGLDSFIAWHFLEKPPVIFFNVKQSYHQKELKAVKDIAKIYKEMNLIVDDSLDLSSYEEPNHYIPYRNIFFSMIASLHARKVYLVGIKGDLVDDNNPKTTALMSKFYKNFNYQQETIITSPFYKMTKTEIVKWYIDHKLPIKHLLLTRSCYGNSSSGHCGKCASCFRRWVAIENNGIKEKCDSPPWKWSKVKQYIAEMKAGKYDKDRVADTFRALKKYMDITKY